MDFYAIIDPASGAIRQVSSALAPTDLAWVSAAGLSAMICDGTLKTSESYYDAASQTIKARAPLPAFNKTTCTANGTDACGIASGLPNPTHVTVAGDGVDAFDVTDGALSVTFVAAGSYHVTLDAGVQYLRSEVEIMAS